MIHAKLLSENIPSSRRNMWRLKKMDRPTPMMMVQYKPENGLYSVAADDVTNIHVDIKK
jgi:hypothetical protein